MKEKFSSIWRVAFTLLLVLSMGLTSLLSGTSPALAAPAPSLATAGNYAVLAGTTITNTGTTVVIGGDIGVAPGSAYTGFPPGTVLAPNIIHPGNDAATIQAQSDLTAAYLSAAGQPITADLSGTDLGLVAPLVPGVYRFTSSAQLTGTLHLNDATANDVWIFQIGSSLTTASNSAVIFDNGFGQNCNVFWQVGSSATLGTSSAMVGNILALTTITMNTGATLAGRALARNGAVNLASNPITVCNLCNPILLAPPALPDGILGVAYPLVAGTSTISATGGLAPYTFNVILGTLPTGLTLNPGTGVVGGMPLAAGTFTFTVQATDSAMPVHCLGSRIYTIVINTAVCGPITLTPTVLPAGTPGLAYTQAITAAGGTAPYTYSVTFGSLPPGMVLSTLGTISGIPTTGGSYTFTVTATDSGGPPNCLGAQIYTLIVIGGPCPPITLALTSLRGSIAVSSVTNFSLTASGGQHPYLFFVTSGSLPPGLTLSRGGTISGIPTTIGNYSFTIRALDLNGCLGSTLFKINITEVPQPGTTHGSSMINTAPPSSPTSVGGVTPPAPPIALAKFLFVSACVEIQGNSDKVTVCLKNTTADPQKLVAKLLSNNVVIGQKTFELSPNAQLCDSWVVEAAQKGNYRVNIDGVVEKEVSVCPGGSSGPATSSSDWLLYVVIALIVIGVIGLLVYYLMSRRQKA
jgi:hypothetical protein